jgi:hypothetical protein
MSQKIAVGAAFTFLTLFLVGLSNLRPKGSSKPMAMAIVTPEMSSEPSLLESLSGKAGANQGVNQHPEPSSALGNSLALDAMVGSQRLIRTGALSLEVMAFDATLGRLQQIASDQGGYIADLRANRKEAGQASGTVVIRVLPARYFLALEQSRGLGKVESEAIQTQDVTRAYADLESRLRNKRELETRMREILRTRTAKLSDLLEAEGQLSKVTEDIERMEGERRYYQQMTGFSTLTLELHEPLVPQVFIPKAPPLWAPVREAFQQSSSALVQATAWAVAALVFLLPWTLLGWLGWVAIKKVRAHRALPES